MKTNGAPPSSEEGKRSAAPARPGRSTNTSSGRLARLPRRRGKRATELHSARCARLCPLS